jgi:hypothetical protein
MTADDEEGLGQAGPLGDRTEEDSKDGIVCPIRS